MLIKIPDTQHVNVNKNTNSYETSPHTCTVFPPIVYAITINLDYRVIANRCTKRGRILNEGEYNYVEHCNLKRYTHKRDSHVFVAYSKQFVPKSRKRNEASPYLLWSLRSFPTRLHRRFKLKRDRRYHRQGC